MTNLNSMSNLECLNQVKLLVLVYFFIDVSLNMAACINYSGVGILWLNQQTGIDFRV